MESLWSKNVFMKYRRGMGFILGACVLAGLVVPLLLTPRYKVSSVISISPSYFQNSLVREFLSETYDPAELRSQRQSLISSSLDNKFLDAISEKVGMRPANETAIQAAERRHLLLRSIEVISLQSSDFQVSVIDADRERALKLNQEVIQGILAVLKEKRTQTLANLRSAIATQLDSMVPTQGLINHSEGSSLEALKMRMDSTAAELQSMKATFAESHPSVQAQQRKLDELKNLYQESAKNPVDASGMSFVDYERKNPTGKTPNPVYEDLSRKYRYLNIVLLSEAGPKPAYFSVVRSPELPLSPLWPKKSLFLVWSTLLGILISLAYAGIKEFMALQRLVPAEVTNRKSGRMDDKDFIEPTPTSPSASPEDVLKKDPFRDELEA